MGDQQFIPDQASTFASQMDTLFTFLLALSVFFTLVVFIGTAYFVWKYRAGSKADRTKVSHHNTRLELAWTIIPTILALFVFGWSAKLYVDVYTPPSNALPINVIGKQWMWQCQHPDGTRENNELHVPVNRPVKLVMTSQDVIHSFFVPAFRIKKDVVPNRYTTVWFEATKTGKFRLLCAEFCGTEHSLMTGWIYVMTDEDYQAWLKAGGPHGEFPNKSEKSNQPASTQTQQATPPKPSKFENAKRTPIERGEDIYGKMGCGSCHGETAVARGPSHSNIMGTKVELEDGKTVLIDEDYLRESIMDPNAKVVRGYQRIMPSYKGLLSEEQIFDLIAYIKSQSPGTSNSGSQ